MASFIKRAISRLGGTGFQGQYNVTRPGDLAVIDFGQLKKAGVSQFLEHGEIQAWGHVEPVLFAVVKGQL